MKIITKLTLLAVLVALFGSCKKSDKTTGDTQPKKLKYLTRVTIVSGTNTSFLDYTYDDKNRISTIKSGALTTTYTYKGSDLFSEETINLSAGFRETIEYAYNSDGSLASAHDATYRNNTLSTDVMNNYFVVNGRITENHHDMYVDKYTYDDKGNLATFYSAVTGATLVYTYDDKPNIYTNGFPKHTQSNYYSITPNNMVNVGTTTFTYTYGTDGYPTGAVLSAAAPAPAKNYSYTYTEM